MHAYRSKGIKDIIAEFPGIGRILEEYGIGCGPCTVGICQLKDILEIHRLTKDAEEELMLRIEAEIYPERNIDVSSRTAVPDADDAGDITLSRPLQVLVEEHNFIKRWLALIPTFAKDLDLGRGVDRQFAEGGIDLIRSYADRLHHGKEEDILFTYFDVSADIFQVIYEDHRKARALVQQMLSALEENNSQVLADRLLEYAVLLEEHIHKEDEVLFPWLDSRLTADEQEEIMALFKKADNTLALNVQKYQDLIEMLGQQAR